MNERAVRVMAGPPAPVGARLTAISCMVSCRHRFAPVGCTTGVLGREYNIMRSKRGRLVFAALALLVIGRASAAQQTAKPDGAWRPVADPIAGWHALGPVLLSVTAVAGFGTGDLNVPAPGSKFVLAAVEPGIQAGRLSLLLA